MLEWLDGLGQRPWISPVICIGCGGISDQAEGAKTSPKLVFGKCASGYCKRSFNCARSGTHPRTGAGLSNLAPPEEHWLAAQLAGAKQEAGAEAEEAASGST